MKAVCRPYIRHARDGLYASTCWPMIVGPWHLVLLLATTHVQDRWDATTPEDRLVNLAARCCARCHQPRAEEPWGTCRGCNRAIEVEVALDLATIGADDA